MAVACPRLVDVTTGPQGIILKLDYGFETSTSKLVTIRFHQPADVDIKQENLKDARDLCYNEGVVFICMWTGSSAISFVDIQNTIQTNVESLKRDALISHLQNFRLKAGIRAVPACSPRYSEAPFEEYC